MKTGAQPLDPRGPPTLHVGFSSPPLFSCTVAHAGACQRSTWIVSRCLHRMKPWKPIPPKFGGWRFTPKFGGWIFKKPLLYSVFWRALPKFWGWNFRPQNLGGYGSLGNRSDFVAYGELAEKKNQRWGLTSWFEEVTAFKVPRKQALPEPLAQDLEGTGPARNFLRNQFRKYHFM